MKTYQGTQVRTPSGGLMVTVSDEHGTRDLPVRLDLASHSPDGFNWGYQGSGPAQLALAILADHLEVGSQASKNYRLLFGQYHYQEFKRDFVAGFGHHWHLTSDEINAWIQSKESAPA